jgi:PAS domain S-box-containing protein
MQCPRSSPADATDWSEHLSAKAIQLRREWLSFTDEDEALVKQIDPLIEANIDPMMDDMYAHFLSFPETQKFFPDEITLKRAQAGQKRYFLRICKGNYDENYVLERLTVGITHYRIGLEPTWYLGAYNRVMTWLRQLVNEQFGQDPVKFLRMISALNRLIFFDMGLAIESYSFAKENSIRKQRDEIANLETEKRVTKGILEGAPSAIVRLDRDFVCLECNQEFLEMNGSTRREQVVGESLFAVAPGLPRSRFQDVVKTGQPLRSNAEALQINRNLQRSALFFDWSVWPIKEADGNAEGLVATFTDVTAGVLLQQQREDFVATLTHDLKTPVLAANRAIKLLLEGDFGAVAAGQRQILETILDSNTAMYKMVQTLLDVYRYDSGVKQLTFVRSDLVKLIRNMVKELQPLATTRGIELKVDISDESIEINADMEEIRRVVQNLVDNALKFTPAGGTISISVNSQSNFTEISIKDTGKGISEPDKPKLFQRFWAAAGSGRYYASTGLGLYLCRKIVESHRGSIWCDSELGKGSTFVFTIENGLGITEVPAEND